MRRLPQRLIWLAICLFALTQAVFSATPVADKKDLLRRARQSYSSLSREGVAGFRCQAVPDWDYISGSLSLDEVGRQQVIPILKATHFQVLVGADGASNVSRQTDKAPPNEQVAERVRKSSAGMEQVLTGFLQTWAPFSVTSPLPDPDSEYQLEDVDGKYRLSYKEGPADVGITMAHDFTMEEMKVVAPEMDGAVHPKLAPSKNGFRLVGYDADFKGPTGAMQHLSVTVEYQEVEGVNLPGTVRAFVPVGANTINISLAFSQCQMTKP